MSIDLCIRKSKMNRIILSTSNSLKTQRVTRGKEQQGRTSVCECVNEQQAMCPSGGWLCKGSSSQRRLLTFVKVRIFP